MKEDVQPVAIPRIEVPNIRLRVKHVNALRKRHRITFAAARGALETMHMRTPIHGERRSEKLHVVVAVKLKGVDQIYIAENNAEHHAEHEIAKTLIHLKRQYDVEGKPFPRIQSLCLVARHPDSSHYPEKLPDTLTVDTLPEGTPCMCEKCVRLFRRLLKYLYPEPIRASEDSDALFQKRYKRWTKTRNFQMLVGVGAVGDGLVLRTNFHTTPIIPFPGSRHAKNVHQILEES